MQKLKKEDKRMVTSTALSPKEKAGLNKASNIVKEDPSAFIRNATMQRVDFVLINRDFGVE